MAWSQPWGSLAPKENPSTGRALPTVTGATIFKWGYLVYLGFTVTWLAAAALFVVGALASLVTTFFEVRLTVALGGFVPYVLGWSGFAALPILAYVLIGAAK